MATKEEKKRIINKYADGKKLSRREAAIIGHIHRKSFGPKRRK